MVETIPLEEIFLIQLFLVSATKRFPFSSNTIPVGEENCDFDDSPSFEPSSCGIPASVVTIPFEEIFRITWFIQSDTKRFPLRSIQIPSGELNNDCSLIPSEYPSFPGIPANVETSPS